MILEINKNFILQQRREGATIPEIINNFDTSAPKLKYFRKKFREQWKEATQAYKFEYSIKWPDLYQRKHKVEIKPKTYREYLKLDKKWGWG